MRAARAVSEAVLAGAEVLAARMAVPEQVPVTPPTEVFAVEEQAALTLEQLLTVLAVAVL